MNKTKYKIILTIFIISLISSIVLSFVSIEKACGSEQNGCYKVQTSNYEKMLGIKNSYIGVVVFGGLSILTFIHLRNPKKYRKNLINLGIFFGFLFALYFIYIQIFKIEALCRYCITIDIGAIINLALILFWKEK